MEDATRDDDAVIVKHQDENVFCRDNDLDVNEMTDCSIKENKLSNNKNTDGDTELCKENDTLKASKNLRFGIEAILKVKSDVTDRLAKKFSENREHLVTNSNENVDVDFDDDSYNEDECGDYIGADNIYDVEDKCFPYVRLPASLQSVRPSDVSLMTSQNVLTMGAMTSPWTSSIINDVRKERFTPIRRIGHPYQNRTPPKRKKPRTSFTRLQILELEKRFERQKYLASTERSTLAKSLKMSDAQVKTWFQNRRTKWRRQTAEERELERQAANRLLFSLQSDPSHRKSMVISGERMCLSHLQRLPESRPTEI